VDGVEVGDCDFGVSTLLALIKQRRGRQTSELSGVPPFCHLLTRLGARRKHPFSQRSPAPHEAAVPLELVEQQEDAVADQEDVAVPQAVQAGSRRS
jgi:hypothetical protein